MKFQARIKNLIYLLLPLFVLAMLSSCNNQQGTSTSSGLLSDDVASQVYVPPGEYDEFYAFISGGFSGQMSVYGLPSGRLLKVIPVFSVDAEKGYGFNEETKAELFERGMGLNNTLERLRSLFGEHFTFLVENLYPGVRNRIEIPLSF